MRKGPAPWTWKTGPDPVRHEQYVAWHRARAQCRFRGEPWNLTFDEWVEFWGADWSRRGRGPGQVRMTRRDWNQPWQKDNMVKMEQIEHNTYNRQRRKNNHSEA